MPERHLRLILVGVMCVTLLLPLNQPPDVMPNGIFICWYSMMALSGMIGEPTVGNIAGWMTVLLGILSVPLLILLNVCLVVRPFRVLRMFYMIFVLVVLSLTWYGTFGIEPQWRGVGFWANTIVVSVAMLLEVVLLIKGRLRKSEDGGQKMT